MRGTPGSRAGDVLGRAPLLSALEPAVLDALAARAVPRRWSAGALVLRQGEPGEALLLLEQGTVLVFRRSPGGARAVLSHLRAPAVLGEVTVLTGARRTAEVEAVTDVAALELSRAALLAVAAREPALLDGLLRALGHLVAQLSDRAADAALLDLPGRVAKTLLALAGPGDPPVVRLSQARVAELALGSRQTANQVLRALAARGLLHREGRDLVLDDVEGLRARAGLPRRAGP